MEELRVGGQLAKQLNSIAHREWRGRLAVIVWVSAFDMYLSVFHQLLRLRMGIESDVSTDEGQLIKQLVTCEKAGEGSRGVVQAIRKLL